MLTVFLCVMHSFRKVPHPNTESCCKNTLTLCYCCLTLGFSENPTLTSAYAKAAAIGFQGVQPAGKWDYFNATKVVALGKHYAAYGAAAGGLNGGPAELSERCDSVVV